MKEFKNIKSLIDQGINEVAAINKNDNIINEKLKEYLINEYIGYAINVGEYLFVIDSIDDIEFNNGNSNYYAVITGRRIYSYNHEYLTAFAVEHETTRILIHLDDILNGGCFKSDKFGNFTKIPVSDIHDILTDYLPCTEDSNGKQLRYFNKVAYIEDGKICKGTIYGFNEDTKEFTVLKYQSTKRIKKKGSELTKY